MTTSKQTLRYTIVGAAILLFFSGCAKSDMESEKIEETAEEATSSTSTTSESQTLRALTVTIQNEYGTEGNLVISLFSEKDGYPDDTTKAFQSQRIPAIESTYTFTDLPEDEYVVVVFHDQNGNSVLDKSGLRFPKEPIGMSNHDNPGPPNFDKAKVDVRTVQSIIIKMNKLPGM
jgi:uncharacterized protein (DUF2141 family)